MEDLISVVVPVYNVERYLDECIKSIINQTYRNLEIILVDDGSTDGSGEICDEYVRRDNRIIAFHKENGGLSSARNYGIKKSTGKYVSFIDSDDYISIYMLEYLHEAIINSNSKIACCDFKKVFDNQTINNLKADNKYEILDFDNCMKMLFSYNHYRYIACNKLFDKNLFNNIKFPENRYYEDIWPIYNIFKRVDHVVYIRQYLYFYRCHRNSITQSNFSRKDYDLIHFLNLVKRDCIKNYNNLYGDFIIAYIYYYLSFINKAILTKSKCIKSRKYLKKYIKKYWKNILNSKDTPFARKCQVIIYGISFDLYSLIYKAKK